VRVCNFEHSSLHNCGSCNDSQNFVKMNGVP
jgi:hypothetical protein